MRLLLDTHTAIWSIVASHRLPEGIVDLLADPEHEVFVSIVNLMEIAIKNAPGRRDRMPLAVDDAAGKFLELGFGMLPVEREHVRLLEALPSLHRDPFDRLLIAQASGAHLRLLTHDRTLSAYGDMVLAF